jgi:hypothetical protein
MTTAADRPPPDPLTAATVTVAWVIVANKPFDPLYVWWLTGDGVLVSCWTMSAAPLFLLVILGARRHPLGARVAVPLVGMCDTLFETKLFGQDSGTELFLAPCIMLAAVSFYAGEKWWRRSLAALIFAAFALAHDRLGAALHAWSDRNLAALLDLNAFAVASLMAFIALRWPSRDR